jgi:hypothetical protein
MSLVPVGDSSEAFVAILRRDFKQWANVVRESGVRAEWQLTEPDSGP